MKKEQLIQELLPTLERMENEDHVTDLANNRRYLEVECVLTQIDYDEINKLLNNIWDTECKDFEVADIPEVYRLTVPILLSKSQYDECDLFHYYDEFAKDLEKRGTAGALLVKILKSNCINVFGSFIKLMQAAEKLIEY